MAYDFSRMTVLIVEDSMFIRRLFVDVLQNFGIGTIVQCSDGLQALDEMQVHEVDIIFTDWMMEPMGGIELVQRVRSSDAPCDPYVPIVMLTSHAQRHRVETARDAGATEFLAKPCTPQTIYTRLSAIIERPRAFVRSPDYAGPDRRRKRDPLYPNDRRGESYDI